MSTYYSPLRYPGGKNCIFPFMSRLFYENQLLGCGYAEPYAGGAGLALRLLFEGYVDHIYINDLDKSIFSFWKAVIDYPDDLCEWINNVDISIINWKKYKDIQINSELAKDFELAKSTFFLNRTNVSGVIKGGVIGGQSQKGKYKIGARFNREELIGRIQRIKQVKERISVSNFDGIRFVEKLDKRKEEILIYLDPPYFQKGARLYMNSYSKYDHELLSKKIRHLKKKWLVSYDNHDFVLNLYSEQRKVVHKISQSASNRVGDEIFIFSATLNINESINALGSPAFC